MVHPARGASVFVKFLPLFLSALILGGGTLTYFLMPDFQAFCQEAWQVPTSSNEARVAEWVSQFGLWGPVLLLALFFVQMVAFVIPSWLLILVCTLAYGPWWGSGLGLIGFWAYTERLQRGLIWASVVCLVGFGIYVWWDKKRVKTK